MLGMIIYLGGCLVVSALVTFLAAMAKPIQARDEMKSWKTWIILMVLTTFLPYGYVEGQTALFKDEAMQKAITRTVWQADIPGEFQYGKVMFYKGTQARVIGVTKTTENWGGTERAVIAMTLNKTPKGTWAMESYRIVNYDSRNYDGWTFPPYY